MSILQRRSLARERIYYSLLETPKRQWTVRALLADIAGRQVYVSEDAVRATLYLLTQARLMSESWHENSLLFTLTQSGEHQLNRIVRSWRHATTKMDTGTAS